jgi:hypothetical protein
LDFDGFGFFISWSTGNILKCLKHLIRNIHSLIDAFKQILWDGPWTQADFVISIWSFNNTRVYETLDYALPETEIVRSFLIEGAPHHFFASPSQPCSLSVKLNAEDSESFPVQSWFTVRFHFEYIFSAILHKLFWCFGSFLQDILDRRFNLVFIVAILLPLSD